MWESSHLKSENFYFGKLSVGSPLPQVILKAPVRAAMISQDLRPRPQITGPRTGARAKQGQQFRGYADLVAEAKSSL